MTSNPFCTFGACALALFSLSANADLFPRLEGKVVYDADRDITWLADANLAASNSFGLPSCDEVGGFPACLQGDGTMEHAYIDAWLTGMNADGGSGYLGFNGWRLPKTLIPDPSCEFPDSNEFHGANCTGSEMGHLFYEELGGTAGEPILNSGDPDLALFSNIQADNLTVLYWTNDFAPSDDPEGTWWSFSFFNGDQSAVNSLALLAVWPVADGDVFGPGFPDIDIKPRNSQNTINPRARGGVWVAILSDTTPDSPFDPSSQIDIPTVEFGPDGAKAVGYKVKDVNKDGLGDLLVRFKVSQTGIACGDTVATLVGETFVGVHFVATDSIKTVGCKRK